MGKETQSQAWSDLNFIQRREVADSLIESINHVASAVMSNIAPGTTRTVIKPSVGKKKNFLFLESLSLSFYHL